MQFKNKKGGFTLIELLVVIAIIGLLSSVVLASLNTTREKARNAKRLTDLNQYKRVFEMAVDDNGEYPDPGAIGWRCLGKYSDNRCFNNNVGLSIPLNNILKNYISPLPAVEGFVYWDGYIYQCINRSPCNSIEVRWMMEGTFSSCGGEISLNPNLNGMTYCQMRRSF